PAVTAQDVVHVEENRRDHRVAAPASGARRSLAPVGGKWGEAIAALLAFQAEGVRRTGRDGAAPQCASREGSGGGNVSHPQALTPCSAHIHRRLAKRGSLEPER